MYHSFSVLSNGHDGKKACEPNHTPFFCFRHRFNAHACDVSASSGPNRHCLAHLGHRSLGRNSCGLVSATPIADRASCTDCQRHDPLEESMNTGNTTSIFRCKKCGIETRHRWHEWKGVSLLLWMVGRPKMKQGWVCTKCGRRVHVR